MRGTPRRDVRRAPRAIADWGHRDARAVRHTVNVGRDEPAKRDAGRNDNAHACDDERARDHGAGHRHSSANAHVRFPNANPRAHDLR